MGIVFPLLALFVCVYVIRGIRIAGETQRYAVFRMGAFVGLKGPGPLFLIPQTDKGYPLVLGQRGELMNEETTRFKGIDVPVIRDMNASIGCIVQITGFDADKVIIAKSSDQTRSVHCEKCGHEMRV
jgi:regulator of protease activity HflC (stomatin/prohibitin superfamily)